MKKIYLFIAGGLVGSLIIVWFVLFLLTPKITSSSIKNNENNFDPKNSITFTFNKDLIDEQLDGFKVETDFAIKPKGEKSIKKNTMTFKPNIQTFFPETDYRLTLKILGPFKIPMRTINIKFRTGKFTPVLGKEEERIMTEATDVFEDGKEPGFEFIKNLPLDTEYFVIENVDVIGEQGQNYIFMLYYKKDKETSEKKFYEWLKERNINKDKVKISYTLPAGSSDE